MLNRWRRDRKLKKVKPGDGHPMKPYRWWQPLTRSMFSHEHRAQDGGTETYTVSVDYFDFSSTSGAYRADLYRNGKHHASADLPALFSVPGGHIEVAATLTGLKRIHFIPQGAHAKEGRLLTPDPRSGEGLRAALDRSHPAVSAWIGRGAVVVLLIALILGIPQTIEAITHVPWVAENIGTFTSPIQLPAWANTALLIAGALAALERALTIRYHWLLDGDFGEWDD